jgi:predicted Holliday junction resolvase-like endonuclease
MDWISSVILPAVIGLIAAYVSLRLLPLDVVNRKSDTISKLYGTVEKLVNDMAASKEQHTKEEEQHNKEIAELNAEIHRLKKRNVIALRTEFHILLEDKPVLKKSLIEYVDAIESVEV